MPEFVDRYPVIDIDTHICEPEDLWTSRVSSKWGDLIPHVAGFDDEIVRKVLHDNAARVYHRDCQKSG